MKPNQTAVLLSAGILLAGVFPLLLYWPAFAQAPVPMTDEALPLRTIGWFEQWLVVFTAFAVKPAYMVLSLLWVIWLRGRRAADLAALRWGLIWFLAGESACAINYLCFAGRSNLTDYLHSYGMVVGFSFTAYAVLEAMDRRLIKYSPAKDRCAALSLCRACIKYADVPCGLRRLFSLMLPALIVVAFMPLCASAKVLACKTCILSSVQLYSAPLWGHLFENRYCTGLAILLLSASWVVLLFKTNDPVTPAKVLLAAALGPLGFGLMRLFLRAAYSEDLVWSNIWEELTELVFVVGVGFVLWIFREALFREETAITPEPHV